MSIRTINADYIFNFLNNINSERVGLFISFFIHFIILLIAIGIPNFFASKPINIPTIIPIDIVNLGLVYKVTIDNDIVNLEMTMTSPGCPSAREIIMEAQTVVSELDGVKETNIEIVWDPPWSPEKMSEEAKLSMGID